MRRIRYNQLPDNWTVPEQLSRCEIFVFESTLEGEHTEGNAKIAYERFGQSGVWVPEEQDRHTPFPQTLCV